MITCGLPKCTGIKGRKKDTQEMSSLIQVPQGCVLLCGCGGQWGFAFPALRGGNSLCKASSAGSTNVLSS